MLAARNRMMAAVPEADVVVTNPTHFAVALRYDGSHAAPEVVAKVPGEPTAEVEGVSTAELTAHALESIGVEHDPTDGDECVAHRGVSAGRDGTARAEFL